MLTASSREVRAKLTGLVTPEVLDDDGAAARHYAHAIWSCVTEPGDGVAGALIAECGVIAAVEAGLGSGGTTNAALEAGRRRWQARLSSVEDALDRARHVGARLLVPGNPDWPVRVDDLGVHAPRALWARGNVASLAGDSALALVGARAATGYGEHVTGELATHLSRRGATIVSGGAYGIDGMAHRATLAVDGVTVAVLAGGVDRPYPAGHADLLGRIARGPGVVVAEVPCGTPPTKWRFLQRNRLIAALSDATVVVEAGWRSGSLNTAGHAAALGRALGAVPGPVTSAASAGCHRLLREYDARCVTSADDASELLGAQSPAEPVTSGRTDDRTRVLDALSVRSPREPDDVARRAGFGIDEIRGLLAILELDGRARRGPEGWRRVTSPS
ncbi:DNA-protecting protein DprA [Microbacterium oleivorans]|uniref:Putative Rossmann fold nucleotide-binding protein n=1 Tax=Microbacterium oleivorans TaxID=273677 RepID=A0A031FYB9_9MICO|nr:DNA-processing protein DprA [Microbacterium oleivorans]EZP29859.1 putative Rossmann fold nucleotide-binding protein [Microbacterium oleivorans]THE07119.1 DNA-protecting protein DprA [Microbacterium oleivorans]